MRMHVSHLSDGISCKLQLHGCLWSSAEIPCSSNRKLQQSLQGYSHAAGRHATSSYVLPPGSQVSLEPSEAGDNIRSALEHGAVTPKTHWRRKTIHPALMRGIFEAACSNCCIRSRHVPDNSSANAPFLYSSSASFRTHICMDGRRSTSPKLSLAGFPQL